ncbi:MAG: hypothetical protein P4L59_18840 [Desulfosporosinus sp.]|nr:hypothetical protein [Desulfosporosinus sp.]
MSVTKEVHEAYYEQERRDEYYRRMKKKLHQSYDELSATSHPAEEQLFVPPASVEELAERELTLEILFFALGKLADDERELVEKLYFENKSEREYARSTGVPQTTVLRRRERILVKIRKLIAG